MAQKSELDHLLERERQSRALATESGDVSVRLAHEKMADAYAAQILVHQKRNTA